MSKNYSLPSETLEQLREPPRMAEALAKFEKAWPMMSEYRRGKLDMLLELIGEGSIPCQR